MADKKSTIHDIARELSVTASTVSRALNDNPRISEDMRRTVKETAQRLGYEPNHIASALRSGRTRIIGIIVPTANRSFFSNVVRGVEAVAQLADYNAIICQSNDDPAEEADIVDTLLRLRVDGIIASIARETRHFDHFRKVRDKGVPLVLFDRVNEALGASTVVLDDQLGAYQATEHLVKQGFKRIAHFAGPQHLNIYKYRLRGYADALDAAGIPFDESLVTTGNLGVEDGREYMSRLLSLPHPPDAVFSASDYSAVGAMQVLKERGVHIPRQIGLVGFANEMFTSLVEPGLTTVDQHSESMGEFAAKIFFEEIESEGKSFVPRKTVLTPTLVVRGSSKRN
ncbi:MAG: LacI family DNA-binding transcriptional regulator [Saprospiraceae bacterium]|nr:LacI family DNA-binding transcriptional regulator [Saprospiraceae bacterium]